MKHLVGVYGTLKMAYGNHMVMKEAEGKYIRNDWVQVESLRDVGFPCVKFSYTSDKWLEVELYEVEEKNMHHLDRLEGYHEGGTNNHYNRIKVDVLSTEDKVYVYEICSDIPEEYNTLEKHFKRKIPSPRFYDWSSENY